MSWLLLSVFDALDNTKIIYCLLRDSEKITQIADRGGEVDVLVQGGKLLQVRSLLSQFGFVCLRSWGHAPHHFFVAYDQMAGVWLKLDLVTEIAYGKTNHALRTNLAGNLLSRRQLSGPVFVPSPEDELVTMLLHCVLDKENFAPDRRQRLTTLIGEVGDPEYLSMLLEKYWSPGISSARIITLIQNQDWEALLAERDRVTAYISSQDKLGTLRRQIQNQVMRKINRWFAMLKPRSPMVALLAPDGAGKSTLAAALQRGFYFRVHSVYMGLYQKGSNGLNRSQLRGSGFIRRLFLQWRRYLIARYHQGRGRLVIFDRYTHDSLLPSQRTLTSGQRWRRWVLAHACPSPDLVILLDAPGELLYLRKQEHSPAILEQQRQAYLRLQTRFPQMVLLDATREAELVKREAISLIWGAYISRQTQAMADRTHHISVEKAEQNPAHLFNSRGKSKSV